MAVRRRSTDCFVVVVEEGQGLDKAVRFKGMNQAFPHLTGRQTVQKVSTGDAGLEISEERLVVDRHGLFIAQIDRHVAIGGWSR